MNGVEHFDLNGLNEYKTDGTRERNFDVLGTNWAELSLVLFIVSHTTWVEVGWPNIRIWKKRERKRKKI